MIIKTPNTVGCLLQQWNVKCNDKNINGKLRNFIKSTKINSPTCDSGATSLLPIGDALMYIETISGSSGSDNAFVVSNELIIYKLLLKHYIITDSEFWLMIH